MPPLSQRPATAVDDEVQVLPEDVHALEARRTEEAELRVERDHVPDVVLVSELLLGGAVRALGRGRRAATVPGPQPRLLDHRVRRRDRVIVEVPAAGGEVGEYLGEQRLL